MDNGSFQDFSAYTFKDILKNKSKIKMNRKKFDLKLSKGKSIGLFLIISFLLFYFLLPPINIFSPFFIIFLAMECGLFLITIGPSFSIFKISIKIMAVFFALYVILNIASSEFFHAKSYANILNPINGDFSKQISEIKPEDIPTIDRDTAERLGERKMGEILDLVSQFNIDSSYTQINYKNNPVRVTPLEYNGFIKWLSNQSEGIPHYLLVDMKDGKVDLKTPNNPIKYSKSELFFRDIERLIRFKYPTKITGEINFEIDDEGNTYWITPTYSPRIWMKALDPNGAIIVRADTGDSKYYDLKDIPSWVDRVFSSSDILRQLSWNGKYKGGFFNSFISQKGVLKPTDGYNYLAIDDDVYFYTGITSVAKDSSNVGFFLVNLRTKEADFYPVSSAEEFSAMASAEGEVQEKNYTATFPLLLNIKGAPTYFISLKDNAGLIKMYAFIDAKNYQNVSIGNTVLQAYNTHINESSLSSTLPEEEKEMEDISGKVVDLKEVVIDGTTNYYILLDNGNIVIASIKLDENLAFLKANDKLSVKAFMVKDKLYNAISIEK